MKTRHSIKDKHLIVDKEWVKEKIKESNLFMIESTYTNLKDGFFAFTFDGYIVKVTANSIYKGQSNPVFSNKNPYTIYNIKRFLFLNNINTILLSTKYINNQTDLDWYCECGKLFKVPWNRFLQGQQNCKKCARRKLFLIPIKKIRKDFENRGYQLITNEPKLKKESVKYKCLKHIDKGVQSITLKKFYDRHQGCRYCGIEKNMESHIISKSECKEITEAKGMNYINSYIKDGRTLIEFTCNKHIDKGIQYYFIHQMRNTRYGCKYCNMAKYTNEEKIDSLLTSWKIHFERQRSFKDCRDKNALPFDFYIPEYNMLIEYQGEQHYKKIKRGNMSDEEVAENLKLIQYHDKIKRDYCKVNNINYIEIPYWENKDIENYIFDKFIAFGIIVETTNKSA